MDIVLTVSLKEIHLFCCGSPLGSLSQWAFTIFKLWLKASTRTTTAMKKLNFEIFFAGLSNIKIDFKKSVSYIK